MCEVRLFGKHKFEIKQQKYKVSDELKQGQARVLFGQCCQSAAYHSCLTAGVRLGAAGSANWCRLHRRQCRRFLDRHWLGDLQLERAYAPRIHFQVCPHPAVGQSPLTRDSFPVEQTAIDAGTLLTWTKGFSAKNAIGQDVVKLLQDAFDKKHIHVRCSALVNDVSQGVLQRSWQC